MPFFYLILCLALSPFSLSWAQNSDLNNDKDDLSIFGGRVAHLSAEGHLARIRVDFANMKFLNTNDRIYFWHEVNPQNRCLAVIKGKTNQYVLIKIPDYYRCVQQVYMTTGAYLYFQSEDLKDNLKVAKEVVDILVKKKWAIESKLGKKKGELATFIEKVEAVNLRYQALRDKLNLEWQNEINNVETDKTTALSDYKELEIRLGEIDHKLEQYRIHDHNLEVDRWALDFQLHRKK